MAEPLKINPSHKHICALPLLYISLFVALMAAGTTLTKANEQNWLPPGSSTEMLRDPPAEFIREQTIRDEKWLYGRLLFRSPSLLGEKAVRIGLSCNSCHPNGHINTDFYINGLSDSPGRIDVTHRFWQAGFDDGVSNPIDIPSLRNIRDTAPYGTVNIFPDLPAFTRHVIVTEFAGPEPESAQLKSLVAYLNSIDTRPVKIEVDQELSYLPLLRDPLEKEDAARLRELIDLIRSDYGRRAKSGNSSMIAVRQVVNDLKGISEKAAAQDFPAALDIYNDLMASQ